MQPLAAFFALFSALAFVAPASAQPPQWFLDDIKTLTSGSGRWIADNSAYRSEQEPFDAYGIEWKSSFDGASMSGRLFGLKDGAEAGTFWEFRQYWHPGEKRAVVEQFGWGGAIGVGTLWAEGAGTKMDQRFYAPDGTATRSGHVSTFPDADTHVTESFDIVDGKWKLRRRYVWKRQSTG